MSSAAIFVLALQGLTEQIAYYAHMLLDIVSYLTDTNI